MHLIIDDITLPHGHTLTLLGPGPPGCRPLEVAMDEGTEKSCNAALAICATLG